MQRRNLDTAGLAAASMPLVAGCSSSSSGAPTGTTPPQVARHEGYERAFLEMDADTYTV